MAEIVVPPHMFACLDAKGENYVVEVDACMNKIMPKIGKNCC